jgi:hypothetical protein
MKIRIGNVKSRNDRLKLCCKNCRLALGLDDFDSSADIASGPVFWVFDLSIPKRLYCSVADRLDLLRHPAEPAFVRLSPIAWPCDDGYFSAHFTHPCNCGSLFHFLERLSIFWITRSLKKPRYQRGPLMNDNATYSSLGFQVLLILNRLRNKQRVDDDRSSDEQRGDVHVDDDEAPRRELSNKRRSDS